MAAFGQAGNRTLRAGDYIVAVVNSELVTAYEVEQRSARLREEARRNGAREPATDSLRTQVLDALIDDRVLVTYARDSGAKVDEAELDRAVQQRGGSQSNESARVAQAPGGRGAGVRALSKQSARSDSGGAYSGARSAAAHPHQRLEIDRFIDQQKGSAGTAVELNLAQILVTVPENASEAVVTERKARIDAALARVRPARLRKRCPAKVRQHGYRRENGGTIGLRPASRLPDVFVEKSRDLKVDEVSAEPFRSGGGFHLLKVLERREGQGLRVQADPRTPHPAAQFCASQRPGRGTPAGGPQAPDRIWAASFRGCGPRGVGRLLRRQRGAISDGVARRLRARIRRGDEPARPGSHLAAGGVTLRVHLIQVIERRDVELSTKEVRDQARAALREQKFETAYQEWAKDRARAPTSRCASRRNNDRVARGPERIGRASLLLRDAEPASAQAFWSELPGRFGSDRFDRASD